MAAAPRSRLLARSMLLLLFHSHGSPIYQSRNAEGEPAKREPRPSQRKFSPQIKLLCSSELAQKGPGYSSSPCQFLARVLREAGGHSHPAETTPAPFLLYKSFDRDRPKATESAGLPVDTHPPPLQTLNAPLRCACSEGVWHSKVCEVSTDLNLTLPTKRTYETRT